MGGQKTGGVKKAGKVKKQMPTMTEKERAQNAAKAALLPSTNAAAVVAEYGKTFGEQDISQLITELRSKFEMVGNGDLQLCESMLVGQANALQSIFTNLARKAINQDYLKQYETFLRLALKAQNQCRMTLETLATIKNPPVVFAKQANINHGNGNQQVNNGTPPPASHAGKTINQPNELLEAQHGSKTLDTRTAGAAIGANQALEAVGAIQRA